MTTTAIRNTIRTILDDSREYDASTMRISRSGEVTALKDANKTYAGNDTTRYLIGYVSDIIKKDGNAL